MPSLAFIKEIFDSVDYYHYKSGNKHIKTGFGTVTRVNAG